MLEHQLLPGSVVLTVFFSLLVKMAFGGGQFW
jgi:hypothetical protein